MNLFNFNKTESKPEITANSQLDFTIRSLFDHLQTLDPASEEYAKTNTQLIKLIQTKQDVNPSWRPSADAVVSAGASLLGILLILNFERAGVIATKAIGFIGKLK